MIPLVMNLRIRTEKFKFRLWIPLFLIWLFLGLLMVMLLPFILIAWLALSVCGWRIPLFRLFLTIIELLADLRKTELHVSSSRNDTRVDISII